jgi:hypothetical protein
MDQAVVCPAVDCTQLVSSATLLPACPAVEATTFLLAPVLPALITTARLAAQLTLLSVYIVTQASFYNLVVV